MFVSTTETITSDGTPLPGIYFVTNTATDAFGNIHTWTLVVQIL